LDSLDWEDPVLLERPFFNSLARFSVKQLKLSRVCAAEDIEVETPPYGAWPLRSLDVEIKLAQYGRRQSQVAEPNGGGQNLLDDPRDGQPVEHQDLHDASPASQEGEADFFRLSTSILRLCASTLETLKWSHGHDMSKPIPFDPGLVEFPRLRALDLGSRMKLEKHLAKALIRSSLSRLTIDTTDPVISQCLDEIGRIHALETFVWNSWDLQETQSLDFLSRNTQLRNLVIGLPVSPEFLNRRVIPLLVSSFNPLTSLSLCWADKSIPESSIIAISAIKSLEQLELRATDPTNFDY
jgi:hypothetical protein